MSVEEAAPAETPLSWRAQQSEYGVFAAFEIVDVCCAEPLPQGAQIASALAEAN